jgi:hypothetical protein
VVAKTERIEHRLNFTGSIGLESFESLLRQESQDNRSRFPHHPGFSTKAAAFGCIICLIDEKNLRFSVPAKSTLFWSTGKVGEWTN